MKKFIASLLILLGMQQASAADFYGQLCGFNPNWKNYAAQAPAGEFRDFHSDKEFIQAHLTGVLTILQTNPVEGLSKQQFDSRFRLINVLNAYRVAGKFPVNYYRTERIPVFIDEHNTHCAVGYLMQQTGHEALARRIAAADNYVWVKDIHDPEAVRWQQASGFTMNELKLIQGAYDYYRADAFFAANRYEIPQKPECKTAYFSDKTGDKKLAGKPADLWFRGEGSNGVLNGKWEQNYTAGMPWIVGYYANGKRTGKWEEYYQGTKQLCRTEHWRNNKLNGTRTRFDREGKLVEEIIFKDGNAITKINYDLADSLTWVRTPLDSIHVHTEVYTNNGALIAEGMEIVHNPGNLLWFQNIELTALNSVSISARDMSASKGGNPSGYNGVDLYNTPALVTYKKEGDWLYYYDRAFANRDQRIVLGSTLAFGADLRYARAMLGDQQLNQYDSMRVAYKDNLVRDIRSYKAAVLTHVGVSYHENVINFAQFGGHQRYFYGYEALYYQYGTSEWLQPISAIGRYNEQNQKVGEWKHYNTGRQLYKTESFLIPQDELQLDELLKVRSIRN